MKHLHSIYSQGVGCFLVLAFLASCGSSDSEVEKVVDAEVEDKEITVLQNNLNEVLSQERVAWSNHWAEVLGEFEFTDFKLAMTDSIDPMEMPERNPILDGDPLKIYQFPHPSGDGCIDIYSYKIEAHDSVDGPFLNPDSEVVWYRKDGMKERLLFMGPSGMFEDGVWLGDDKFIVLGYFHGKTGFRPMAWVLNLSTHVLYQFQLDKVAADYNTTSYLSSKIKQVEIE